VDQVVLAGEIDVEDTVSLLRGEVADPTIPRHRHVVDECGCVRPLVDGVDHAVDRLVVADVALVSQNLGCVVALAVDIVDRVVDIETDEMSKSSFSANRPASSRPMPLAAPVTMAASGFDIPAVP